MNKNGPTCRPQSFHRYWINQPSSSQPLHELHGTNVLAERFGPEDNQTVIYFLQGPIVNQLCPTECLTVGWKL